MYRLYVGGFRGGVRVGGAGCVFDHFWEFFFGSYWSWRMMRMLTKGGVGWRMADA